MHDQYTIEVKRSPSGLHWHVVYNDTIIGVRKRKWEAEALADNLRRVQRIVEKS